MTINYSGSKVTDRLRRAFRTVGRANPLLEESLLPVVVAEHADEPPFSMVDRGGFEELQAAVVAERQAVAIGMVDVGEDDVLVIKNLEVRTSTAATIDIGRAAGQVDAGFGTHASGRTDFRFGTGENTQVQAGGRSTAVPVVLDSTVYRTVSRTNIYQAMPGIWVLVRNTALIAQMSTDNITIRFQGVWELYRSVK